MLGATNKVVVFGGGSFGTAMATLLARNKPSMQVVILMRDKVRPAWLSRCQLLPILARPRCRHVASRRAAAS